MNGMKLKSDGQEGMVRIIVHDVVEIIVKSQQRSFVPQQGDAPYAAVTAAMVRDFPRFPQGFDPVGHWLGN